jgi:hypothetical protein
MNEYELTLVRSGETFEDSKGAQGEWAALWVKGIRFDAIERVGGYLRLKKDSDYEVMCYMSAHLGKTLSPVHNILTQGGTTALIRIHAANYPHDLAGCIAPGQRDKKENRLIKSRGSLLHVFELLGGWEEAKSVGTLHVS